MHERNPAKKHMSMEVTLVMSDSDGEPVPGTEHDVAILFNTDVITAKEIDALLASGADIDHDPRLIVTTPVQMRAFRDGTLDQKGD